MSADLTDPSERKDGLPDRSKVSHRTIYVVTAMVLVAAAIGTLLVSRRPTPPVKPTPTVTTDEVSTTARFTMLGGTVKVKPRRSMAWNDATPETVLQKDDLVRTGRDSAADITFEDGTVVHVRPDTLITIEASSQNPRTNERKVAWRVFNGEVNYGSGAGAGPGSLTEVSTDTIRLRHSGPASGAVRVAGGGESDVRLFRGVGQVETKTGQKVALAPNQGVRVSAAGQAGTTVTLPQAPELVAPTNEAKLVYANPSVANTTLSWKAVAGAESYRVVVDVTPGFYRPMVDRLNKDATVRLQGLDVGQYCWKVAAVDRGSAEGHFSEVARFSVTRPTTATAAAGSPPPLSIRTFDVRTNILQIRGQTEPGGSVFVNGEAVTVNADGTFNEFVTLEKAGPQEVKLRAVGSSGGVREETRSVVVAF
jgi:hypothetical protein